MSRSRAEELFARGEFRAAHELWEDEWRACTDGPEREQLRALAQAAAACLHEQAGNARGARSLAARALQALARAPAAGRDAQHELVLARLRELA